MKMQPWHSTSSSDPKVYHDNDRCAEARNVDSTKRTAGTDNRPKCQECDRLDRDETGTSNFESDAGYKSTPDTAPTQRYQQNMSGQFDDRKDRSNDPGNPNNPSPSHPSGPANPTDPSKHGWEPVSEPDKGKQGNENIGSGWN